MFTITTNIRRIAAVSIASATAVAAVAAVGATPALATTTPTSYEVHIANTQPHRLTLQSVNIGPGSHWVFKPPEYLAGNGSGLFEVSSTTAPGGAQASVTYVDPADGSTVTFNGVAAPQPNSSQSGAVTYGTGLAVSGYQGFFAGWHPQLNLHYAVTGAPTI